MYTQPPTIFFAVGVCFFCSMLDADQAKAEDHRSLQDSFMDLLQETVDPDLAKAGFQKVSDTVFFRERDIAIDILDFQVSSFNLEDSYRFYVNVGMCFPDSSYGPFVPDLGALQCEIHARIGSFLPTKTPHYQIDIEREHDQLEASLTADLRELVHKIGQIEEPRMAIEIAYHDSPAAAAVAYYEIREDELARRELEKLLLIYSATTKTSFAPLADLYGLHRLKNAVNGN